MFVPIDTGTEHKAAFCWGLQLAGTTRLSTEQAFSFLTYLTADVRAAMGAALLQGGTEWLHLHVFPPANVCVLPPRPGAPREASCRQWEEQSGIIWFSGRRKGAAGCFFCVLCLREYGHQKPWLG